MLGYDTTLLSTSIKHLSLYYTPNINCAYHMSNSQRIACRGGSVYMTLQLRLCGVPVSFAVPPEFEVERILTPCANIQIEKEREACTYKCDKVILTCTMHYRRNNVGTFTKLAKIK